MGVLLALIGIGLLLLWAFIAVVTATVSGQEREDIDYPRYGRRKD